MGKEGMHLKFIGCVTALAKLISVTSDEFFVEKVRLQLDDFVEAYIRFSSDRREDRLNVAQYSDVFLSNLNAAYALITDLQYLNFAPATPLLHAQRLLLELRLAVLTQAPSVQTTSQQTREGAQAESHTPRSARTRSPAVKVVGGLNQSQEKILRFIEVAEAVRAKEIIEEFSSLSERTVKRNLKELVSQGLLKKRAENKAVFYLLATP